MLYLYNSMAKTPFIQVIVPLRLEWEPFYRLENAQVGDRVQVQFARREYVGVVSALDVQPQTAPERILEARKTDLPPIHPREIAFWRQISEYYLCSEGEVYKAAYPVLKWESEAVKVRTDERLQARLAALKEKLAKARKEDTRMRYAAEIGRIEAMLQGKSPEAVNGSSIRLSPVQEAAAEAVRKAFRAGKTVLLHGVAGSGKKEIYLQMAREVLRQGKSVLYLVPEIALTRQLEDRISGAFPQVLLYHSARSSAQRRAVADAISEGRPGLVLGTRSALFLPHRNLGLVIVDQEQDPSYKQDSPAPRYHARESAILLAGIHGANVLLGSATPSLESLYNAETGLFTKVELKERFKREESAEVMLVNIAAERRKRGMVENLSLTLLDRMKQVLEAGEKVLCVCRSKAAVPEYEAQFTGIFPDAGERLVLTTPAAVKTLKTDGFALIAILQADGLLVKEDFRSDERALQLLQQLKSQCRGVLAVQTGEPGHPVFKALREGLDATIMLPERRQFGYPPYTRIIHVVLKDSHEKRLDYMARELAREIPGATGNDGEGMKVIGPYTPVPDRTGDLCLRTIRLILPRDRQLQGRKRALVAAVAQFEKERKWTGHISIDVDPV